MILFRILSITIFLTLSLFSKYEASIHKISRDIKIRMIMGNSYQRGCPVGIKNLRYLKITYKDFKNRDKIGELVVHKDVAYDVKEIFRELYRENYPIRKMRLVSDYGGSDFKSIEADNTSAFNCRFVDGTKKWSKHAYGRAIDINPLENPYISRSGRISHKASLKYRSRHRGSSSSVYKRAMLLPYDNVVLTFKDYGWIWGGDWRTIKDYQHFEYRYKKRTKNRHFRIENFMSSN